MTRIRFGTLYRARRDLTESMMASSERTAPGLIVRRPFLLCGADLFGRRVLESVPDGLELRFQRLDFSVLSKYDIAELGHGALQIGYFRLDLFQGLMHRS